MEDMIDPKRKDEEFHVAERKGSVLEFLEYQRKSTKHKRSEKETRSNLRVSTLQSHQHNSVLHKLTSSFPLCRVLIKIIKNLLTIYEQICKS